MEKAFEGAIGIDLGTTYSCVSVFLNNSVEVIANQQGSRTTPSRVSFNGPQILVGEAARYSSGDVANVVYDAKRMIGRRFSDKEIQADLKVWPFKVIEGDGEEDADQIFVSVDHNGEQLKLRPEQISAKVLESLKESAEIRLGAKVKNAVITVPAYFNDMQRERTRAAGQIAGLSVLRIINEPTAAALAYGIGASPQSQAAPQNILVFDFGGGTFDVSVIAIHEGAFAVQSTAGDTHLGGQDIDVRIVNHVIAEAKRQHKVDFSSNPKLLVKLRAAAERAKCALSYSTQHEISLDGALSGDDFSMSLSRAKLEGLCEPLFSKCLKIVQKAMDDAKMEKEEINEVILVGGSSRIPKIQAMLRDFFDGKSLCASVNPDEAVSIGAAIQASILSQAPEQKSDRTEGIALVDVVPLSIGVDVDEGKFDVLIARNHTIPYKTSKEYSTIDKNQEEVIIDVYEGERPLVKHNRLLGSFTLQGIHKAAAGVPSIIVEFSIDANGILTVSACEERKQKRGKPASLVVKNAENLSKDDIDKMVAYAERVREADVLAAKLVDQVNEMRRELEGIVESLESIENPSPKCEKVCKAAQSALEWLDTKARDSSADFINERTRKIEKIKRKALKQLRKHGALHRPDESGEPPASDEESKSSGDDGGSEPPTKKARKH